MDEVRKRSFENMLNLRYYSDGRSVGVSLDETTGPDDVAQLLHVFGVEKTPVRRPVFPTAIASSSVSFPP